MTMPSDGGNFFLWLWVYSFLTFGFSFVAFGRLTMGRIDRQLKKSGDFPEYWAGDRGMRIFKYAYLALLPVDTIPTHSVDAAMKSHLKPFDRKLALVFSIATVIFTGVMIYAVSH